MQQPILITGCARSGTSMVAGIINLCGAFGGVMSGPNKNNQKGMFENHRIRQDIVKPYFRDIKVDPLGQFPLPEMMRLKIPMNWKDNVESIFKEQGYKNGKWFYKGAKMCLHWPVWSYHWPNAKWIIVRRKKEDIVNSCLKTGFMRAFAHDRNRKAINVETEREGWQWWVEQHEKRFVEMIMAGLNVKQIWPERMINGDYSQINEMLEWLGMEWKSEITEFIEPKLWKARKIRIG